MSYRLIKFQFLICLLLPTAINAEVINLSCQVKGNEAYIHPQYGVDRSNIGPASIFVKISIDPRDHFSIIISGPRGFSNALTFLEFSSNNGGVSRTINQETFIIREESSQRFNSIEISRMSGLIFVHQLDDGYKREYSGSCEVLKSQKF